MVEKIIVTPEEVRGMGNIISPKTDDDFTLSECTITESTDTVNGTTVTVYELEHLDNFPYQRVEYLQSNGSQYINTGYTLQSDDKVEVAVSMQGTGQYNGVFGARKGSSSTQCYALFGRFSSANKFVYARTGNEKQGSTITTNTVYDVTTQNANCTINQNGTTVETLTSTGTINNCANPCGLFVLNTDSGTGFTKDTYGYMKIYYFKITNANNEVVMELIPVRDGTTGYMYDTVSQTLMTNTGTFLYGDDVNATYTWRGSNNTGGGGGDNSPIDDYPIDPL